MVVILVTGKISRRNFGRLSSYESQAKTWISNLIYHGLFMFNNLRLEVIVRFVDIGGIVYLSLFKLPFHIIILVEDFLSCITSKICLIRPNRKRQV